MAIAVLKLMHNMALPPFIAASDAFAFDADRMVIETRVKGNESKKAPRREPHGAKLRALWERKSALSEL